MKSNFSHDNSFPYLYIVFLNIYVKLMHVLLMTLQIAICELCDLCALCDVIRFIGTCAAICCDAIETHSEWVGRQRGVVKNKRITSKVKMNL